MRKPSFVNRELRLAARVGLAPTPNGLTNRRAPLTPPGNGAAGRILTCIVPLRRRMPDVFGHGCNLKMVSTAGIAPAFSRAQTERVAPTLRADGGPEGTCTLSLPADNGLLLRLSYGSGNGGKCW